MYFDGCYDVLQNCMSFDDAAIVSVGKNDYRINFEAMATGDVGRRMINSDLRKKREQLWTKKTMEKSTEEIGNEICQKKATKLKTFVPNKSFSQNSEKFFARAHKKG